MILQCNDLSVQFDKKVILNQVNFQLEAGEIACLLGESGCGKTTILRSIAGFEHPNQGQIILNQRCLFDAKQHIYIPAHQRRVGMVFQDFALFPHLNINDNIAFGIKHLEKKQRQTRIDELLNLVGLSSHARHFPHELSGGQQQRIALARALAPKPELLLLDEPFSSLDVHLRQKIACEVRQLLKHEQVTALLVTHDQEEAFTMSDHIGLLQAGQLQQWATPFELYYQPANLAVAKFIGQASFLQAQIQQQQLQSVIIPQQICPHSQPDLQQEQTGQLLIRPDDVKIYPKHQNVSEFARPATVTQCDFKGQYYLYQLQFDNQELLTAKMPISQHFDIGSPVQVEVTQATWLTN